MCARCRALSQRTEACCQVVRAHGSMMSALSDARERALHDRSWLVWLNLHARPSAARESRDQSRRHIRPRGLSESRKVAFSQGFPYVERSFFNQK